MAKQLGVIASLVLVLASPPTAAHPGPQEEPCQPGWVRTFGGQPGTNANVHAVLGYDDGGGPALYAGGDFTLVEGLPHAYLARFDGARWSSLGLGVNGPVRAMAVFDDGSGPALYVGGHFTSAGGAPASGIARWDGAQWSTLAGGLSSGAEALAVFDDGNGPALFAGGAFTEAGGATANRIARWNGASWSALGSGVDGSINDFGPEVSALAVFDAGGGPELYVGGIFLTAGGMAANHVARWDGSAWSTLAGGVGGCPYPATCTVRALTVYDDGGGAALYAGGSFSLAGVVPTHNIARWNGSWSALASGQGAEVLAMTGFDDGSGPALYTGNASGVLRLKQGTWDVPGENIVGRVRALTVHEVGGGPRLVAGGDFTVVYPNGGPVGAFELFRLGAFDGQSWAPLVVPRPVGDTVRTLAWLDDGSGPALYAGGDFTDVGGVEANRVARWDGTNWTALGGLGSGVVGPVRALTVYDDGLGSGPALYAAASFLGSGSGVGRWSGSSWTALGSAHFSGASQVLLALAVFDDGSGPMLCVGGDFVQVNGVTSRRFVRWNGTGWILQTGQGFQGDVRALLVFDDGSGPALYAGGDFTYVTGTSNANGIARLSGESTWSSLGGGLPNASISALAAYDTSGAGPELHAGGTYVDAGGMRQYGVWRWNGASWLQLGSGTNGDVFALSVLDDLAGGGPALYVGGSFTVAGGLAAERVARWNGLSWSPLDGGPSGPVLALTGSQSAMGDSAALFTGGDFGTSPSGDRYLARWQGCADTVTPVLSCPRSIVREDRLPGRGEFVSFSVSAVDNLDPAPEIVVTPPSGSHFAPGITWVTATATDASGNSSSCQFTVTVAARVR